MRYILNNKAKGKLSRLAQFCLLATMPFFVGCADNEGELNLEDTVPVTFYLQTAGNHQTRAYIGDLAAETAAESQINTIKVWFFDGTTKAAYSGQISDGNKVTIKVPRSVTTVDAYIIANAGSAGITTLGENSTVSEIKAAQIALANFGTATPTTAVPEAGLPMSRIVKGLSLIDTSGEPKTDLGEIEITRAVSKIYFAFGMYEGDLGDIIGISIDGGQIASQEYILPVDPEGNTADYTSPYLGDLKANMVTGQYEATELLLGAKTGTTALVANADIHPTETTDNPSNYTWTNWLAVNTSGTSEQYYAAIAPFITNKVYLRESDQKLKGKIYYRMTTAADAKIEVAEFEMDAVQDFARNHVWIVYSYFEGGKLWVKPTVAPWTDAAALDYTMNLNTNMRLFDSWLYRYDTDQDYSQYWKWQTSHMVVSDGLVGTGTTGDVENRPLRSPQIQLVTTGTGAFHLVLDNDNFQFVKAVKEGGIITSCQIVDQLDIPANSTDEYTYFYVIPKPGVDWTAEGVRRDAHVTLLYDDPALGTYKVTFNYSALPGYSDDSSEIWVYYFPADEYNNTNGDKLKMYYQNSANPLVPTPVQD